ncbi:GTP cyclohydrolase I FolE [Dethiobacter alkaliphilus]|uniref:GTP cyclohydrolase 1 n=1 Tax=Dethiobacter alkaliphilus AHT 1 TaxID=555088 RepID=C0GCX5_DETAL|nr:GTP cyclohydrolase I FolE [Dethiobacter alkaliphilus]EEG79060.1 GTP cyclohydrolase I [Dethiobacter alkaliphilus AHT 1]MCW3490518.1 GTP cyclohydrolase I FolE [Dethiobacter alkaliphilus]
MIDQEKIQKAVRMILEGIGEDPDREGLQDTPARVAKMYGEVFSGLHCDPCDHLETCFYEEKHDEMVLIKDISIYSMCEHHLLPFYGKAHVAYIPNPEKITGLSKLVRVVETLSRRPQLQERLTTQIADTIVEKLDAKGVVVVIEAEHLCMTIRGVKKPGSTTVTSAVRGICRTNHLTRAEAFSLLKGTHR